MIENKKFFVYSVGANCVRPLRYAVTLAGEHSSPLQNITIEFAFFNVLSVLYNVLQLYYKPYDNTLSI